MTKIKNYTLILTGLFFISFLIWNRLFRERLPSALSNDLTVFSIILYSYFFVIFLSLVAYSIYIRYSTKKISAYTQNSFYNFIRLLSEHKLNPINFLNKSLISLDIFFKNNIPTYDGKKSYLDVLFETSGNYILNKYQFSRVALTLLLIRIIPQTIACLSFLLDIIYYHQFYYFYKTIWLLIFTMLITYIMYSLKTFILINLESLNNIMIFKVKTKTGFTDISNLTEEIIKQDFIVMDVYQWYACVSTLQGSERYLCINDFKESFKEALTNEEFVFLLTICVDYATVLFKIYTLIEKYTVYKHVYGNLIDIIRYLLYAVGWGYMILYGIGWI